MVGESSAGKKTMLISTDVQPRQNAYEDENNAEHAEVNEAGCPVLRSECPDAIKSPGKNPLSEVNDLALNWLDADLTEEERLLTESAMTLLLDNPDAQVRLALANTMALLVDAPRHIVLSLADDEPLVSLPILEHSPQLLDGELVELIAQGTEDQQIAIACRDNISAVLASAIAEHGCQNACLRMLANDQVTPSIEAFDGLAERLGDDVAVRRALLARNDIGMDARLMLIEKYAHSLVENQRGADKLTQKRKHVQLREICDKATITYAAQVSNEEIGQLVGALISAERLSTAYLIRAICMGNISLFAHALSILSGQRLARVEAVLKDGKRTAFRAMFLKSGLPASVFDVFERTITCWRHLLGEFEDDEIDNADLPYLVTKHVLADYHGKRNDDTDKLLLLLRRIFAEAAREKARAHIERLALIRQQAAEALLEVFELEDKENEQADKDDQLSHDELMRFATGFAEELAQFTHNEADGVSQSEAMSGVEAGVEADDQSLQNSALIERTRKMEAKWAEQKHLRDEHKKAETDGRFAA